jgi:hypothetical protein
VTESVAPAPVVRDRVVTPPALVDSAVGSRVAESYALASLSQDVVAAVPAAKPYR